MNRNPPTQEAFEKWKPGRYVQGDTEAENAWHFLCFHTPELVEYGHLCCCAKYTADPKQCCQGEDTHQNCWRAFNKRRGREPTSNFAILEENYTLLAGFVKNGNEFPLIPTEENTKGNRIRVVISDIIKEAPP